MMRKIVVPALILVTVVGCSQTPPPADRGKNESPNSAQPGDQAKLDPLVLPAKPANAITVRDALTRNEGDKVIVTGQVPTEKVKPYNAAVAAFVMLAHEDMAREEIKEEFECEDAATCPSCKKILDQYAVRVEVVDSSGSPVATTLEGYRGLKPGSTITVEGEVKRDGKDKKLVKIVATKFYPG